MCTYGKDQPKANFTQQCLDDHVMSGLNEHLQILNAGGAIVTWRDGDQATYRFTTRDGYSWDADMVEFNGEPVRFEETPAHRTASGYHVPVSWKRLPA
jgi:hypothetical protein